jgi:alpha/beta superfamily hydrolase
MNPASSQPLALLGGAGVIEALADAPANGVPPRGVAVIAHPHPLHGGTMHNKVVQTLARACAQAGWKVIRFNFRGVGASAGTYDEGRGETHDLLAVLEQTAKPGPAGGSGRIFVWRLRGLQRSASSDGARS